MINNYTVFLLSECTYKVTIRKWLDYLIFLHDKKEFSYIVRRGFSDILKVGFWEQYARNDIKTQIPHLSHYFPPFLKRVKTEFIDPIKKKVSLLINSVKTVIISMLTQSQSMPSKAFYIMPAPEGRPASITAFLGKWLGQPGRPFGVYKNE